MISNISNFELIGSFQYLWLIASLIALVVMADMDLDKGNLTLKSSLPYFMISILMLAYSSYLGYQNKSDLIYFSGVYESLNEADLPIRAEFHDLNSMASEYVSLPSYSKAIRLIDNLEKYREDHGQEFVSIEDQMLIIQLAPECFQGEISEYLIDYLSQYPLSVKAMQDRVKRHVTMAGSAGLVPGCALLK